MRRVLVLILMVLGGCRFSEEPPRQGSKVPWEVRLETSDETTREEESRELQDFRKNVDAAEAFQELLDSTPEN